MRKFVIWGSSGHAKVVSELVNLIGGQVVALFDNDLSARSILSGVDLRHGWDGFIEWRKSISEPSDYSGVVAIGGARGGDRLCIQNSFEGAKICVSSIIHPCSIVSSSARIGKGCQVLANATVAADVGVGDACIINHGSVVDHETQIDDGVHIGPGAVLCGCINVGAFAFIGAGSVVLPRLSIGSGAIIGAGSVVTKDVPPRAVVAGNPGRILKFVGE